VDDGQRLKVDAEVRHRLGRRYGPAAGPWLDRLPARLAELGDDWRLALGSFIRRGTVSVVLTCTSGDGMPQVLKISPDRHRVAVEAQALASWSTRHVPHVIASNLQHGALLLEAIRPGTALDESRLVLDIEPLAHLLDALHRQASPSTAIPPLGDRIGALYRSGEANYARRTDLEEVVPRSLYERGRRAAVALAAEPASRTVLHGDLTPANVLDGGSDRGFVAIDPAPCYGDPTFDAVDLLMWQTDDLPTLAERSGALGRHLGLPQHRALDWCAAFAAMNALELAEASPPGAPVSTRLAMLLDLAHTA
jgi:streptomycin 6-kinase